jgi:drug/metabolite transporter (DMT)-like permease
LKSHHQAHLALLGTNLFYGAGFSIAKTVMPHLIGPQAFIIIRVGCTALLFWLSYLIGKNFRATIHPSHWGRLILCALLGVTINQLLFFMGLSLTSPIHASLMMLITPVLVTFIAAYLIKEKVTGAKISGLLFAGIGAAILVSSRSTEAFARNAALGDLFIFLNACSYAFYMVAVKPLMQAYRPIIVIRWVFLIGFFMVLPFGFLDIQQVNWPAFETKHWLAIAFTVVCTTFFTYLWNIYALKILNASIAGAYIYLQPIFAAIISIIFMGEQLNWQKVAAAILIFIGVSIVSKPAKIAVTK